MSTTSTPTIIVRLAVTEDEWRAIQKQAIDAGKRPSVLMAGVLREHLLKGESNGTHDPA